MANGTIAVSSIEMLSQSGTGIVTINPPATNSNFTVSIPAGTGTAVVNGVNGALVSGTAVASTSGTSIDFTGIPSWVKRITVMFQGVSTNGTSNIQIQIGSGSFVTSGYVCAVQRSGGVANFTSGFVVVSSVVSATTVSGNFSINLIGSNIYTENSVIARTDAADLFSGAGSIALGGVLDRIRITTVNGTDTFDAGSINIMYE
jgi:hypothetical protein